MAIVRKIVALMLLGFLSVLSLGAEAFVACSPTSCSPACDSSCNYQVCDQNQIHSIQISSIPYTYNPPGSACDGTSSTTITSLSPSQRLGPETVDRINVSLGIPYKTCRTLTAYGPACPLPTPSPTPSPSPTPTP